MKKQNEFPNTGGKNAIRVTASVSKGQSGALHGNVTRENKKLVQAISLGSLLAPSKLSWSLKLWSQEITQYLTNTMSTYPTAALISAVFCVHCYTLGYYCKTSNNSKSRMCNLIHLLIMQCQCPQPHCPNQLVCNSTCDAMFWVTRHPH